MMALRGCGAVGGKLIKEMWKSEKINE